MSPDSITGADIDTDIDAGTDTHTETDIDLGTHTDIDTDKDTCCCVLQCVAVRCCVLQCVAAKPAHDWPMYDVRGQTVCQQLRVQRVLDALQFHPAPVE